MSSFQDRQNRDTLTSTTFVVPKIPSSYMLECFDKTKFRMGNADIFGGTHVAGANMRACL